MVDSAAPKQIIIVGGGIIGICAAYYLLTSPDLPSNSNITLIENSPLNQIASGASSSGGGFLAGGYGSSWQETNSRDLARLSWNCHNELASLLNGVKEWGFRECGAIGLRVGGGDESKSVYRILPGGVKEEKLEGGEGWVEGEREDLASEKGIGQIDPAVFCQFLHAHCTKLGLTTLFGNVLNISPLSPSTLSRSIAIQLHTGSIYETTFTNLLISAGPWSASVCASLNLPTIPLSNLPGHSILIRPALSAVNLPKSNSTSLPAEAIFAGISGGEIGVHASTSGKARNLRIDEIEDGYTRSPELFPRSNGLVYVAGENSIPATVLVGNKERLDNRLPEGVEGVKALLDKRLISRLAKAAGKVSKALMVENGAVIVKEQFCYRPVTSDGEPLICQLEPGVVVSTGHGPWGITLAPGSGKLVAEMILTGQATSADISKLGLKRFSKIRSSHL